MKNSKTGYLAILFIWISGLIFGQANDAKKKAENNVRINELLKEVDLMSAKAANEYSSTKVDSLLSINNYLNKTIASKDSLIKALYSQINKSATFSGQSSANPISKETNYIVIGTFSSEIGARYSSIKQANPVFGIVKSKSGKFFYVATPVMPEQEVKTVLNYWRSKTVIDAWWVKL